MLAVVLMMRTAFTPRTPFVPCMLVLAPQWGVGHGGGARSALECFCISRLILLTISETARTCQPLRSHEFRLGRISISLNP